MDRAAVALVMDRHTGVCSVPGDNVGYARDFLLEPALGMGARCAGIGICRVLGVGVMGGAISKTAKVIRGCVRRRRGLVDIYTALARPSVAARGRSNAPRDYRRRPSNIHRFPQLQIPEQG